MNGKYMHNGSELQLMPAISIRDIPAPLYETLRVKAAENHRSLNKEVIVAQTAHVRDGGAMSSVSATERLAKMQQILSTAPRINKRSKAYRTKEEDILGYGASGHFE